MADWFRVRVGDIVAGQRPIVALADDPVEKAVEMLIRSRVSSVPVWDPATASWVGSFDYADLVSWIVQIVKAPPSTPPPTPTSPTSISKTVASHLASLPTPVATLTDASLSNPWATVTEDEELGAVVGALGGGMRRVGVIGKGDATGGLVGVLTQSHILKYLLNHKPPYESLAPLLKTPIASLGLTRHHHVVFIDSRKKVLDALEMMAEHNVQALPVVEMGRVVGNVSMSDVKHVLHPPTTGRGQSSQPSHIHLLSQPLLPFIHAIAQAAALERPDAGDRFPVWTVRGGETLQRVWGLCVATGGHRVWGVDEAGKPSFVISLTDILRVLTEHIPASYFSEQQAHPGLGSGKPVEAGSGGDGMES
ncbi:hypothetical protein DFJ74DRAFT_683782 [Hyaloraphidium curvatum]|nr:hypothetical protein DFJ74DRAFT_683782 [Hyaloraphidium curvatum]